MRLREIFGFELAYQVRRAWPWLFSAVLLVFAFLMTRDGSLAEALYEDFLLNSPFAIAKTTVTGSLIWLLIAAAVAGEAAGRDVVTRMDPLIYTAPVSRAEYLGGRFLAAFVLNALILLAVQAGILLGVYLPGVDPVMIGPFRPAAYLTAYGFIALPNAFAATAIQFALAARKGRPMASYLGSLLLFFIAYVLGLFLVMSGRQDVARLLDPVGVHFILSDLSHMWTTIEKSWRLIELEGMVLTNRVLWVGIGAAALGATWVRFRFTHRVQSAWWTRRRRERRAQAGAPASPGPRPSGPVAVPAVQASFGFASQARRTLAVASTSFRAIATSWAGLALLGAIPLMTVPVVLDQMESGGARLVPTTALVLAELTAPLSAEMSRWVIIPLLLVFFAGELVWRERDAGVGEITDAMPGSEWVPLLGKLLGLGVTLLVFSALLMGAGMLAQGILGYRELEPGLYLKALFGLQLTEYLLFALLALVVHVVVDQKYMGHLVGVMAFVAIAMASLFGIEHDLLIYGAGPGWSYTEMRGFGPSLGPWLWFKLYWAAWALVLAVVARLLWVRGRESGIRVRLRLAQHRLTPATARTAAAAVALVLILGGFTFYNTNVLNEYLPAAEIAERRAEYERRYGQYRDAPQPRLAATTLNVEIHPDRRAVDIRGTYRLVNRGAAPIDSIHVTTVPGIETREVELDRAGAGVLEDEELHYRIYALEEPLQPGDSLGFGFEVRVAPRGFGERGINDAVVANGTSFDAGTVLPAIGYQASRELSSGRDRREHGLPERPLVPRLPQDGALPERGGGTLFEAVVGTREDQVAVAPGALRRTWTENGRRYFHYSSDGPIGSEWSVHSAAYAVHEDRWEAPDEGGQDVAIRVFHHPGHTAHLERTLRSIKASLDYYTSEFGPYPYGHLTVVERPGNGTGLHADATMITHGEGFSLWGPEQDPDSLDLPFAVVAHEVAHQWTVPYAFVEGAPVMSEGIAWYYAIRAVEDVYGEQVHELLRIMRRPQPYPPIRRGEPLLRGLDPYMSYRRGPFALYALGEYVGEERVNTALRRLVEKHEPEGAPLATTLDLYRELQAVTPDSLRYLLHDLFEVNTFWELETERATAQEVEGSWEVTLEVRARKVVYDSAGVETEVPMDEWVEIGVFARAEQGGELSEPLHVLKHRVRSGEQTITVMVPEKPVLAGIDPYHLLDWEEREDDDNIAGVDIESPS